MGVPDSVLGKIETVLEFAVKVCISVITSSLFFQIYERFNSMV